MSAAAEFRWTPDAKTELCLWFANAPVGLAECQLDGSIIAMNPALEGILGGRPQRERRLNLADVIVSQESSERARLRELLEGERNSFQSEATAFPLRWTAWRVPGANGAPDSVIALAEPATVNREAEHRPRQGESLEAVGRLAGGVVHDFNNLLTGVLLYCDLILSGLEPGHRIRRYAEEIRKAGVQASGLVRQLLALSRPTRCEPCRLSLNEIAQGMDSLLARLIGENIQLQSRLDPRLGLIRMDPAQAQQIILNLVLNARDALPGGGQITVETSNCKVQVFAEPLQPGLGLREPGFVKRSPASIPCALLVVEDNGCGMDADTRSHLFEAFFTTKAAGRGTGLGLATVHDIVTANGGLIYVDSAPGCGTRFSVLLPLAPETITHSRDKSQSSERNVAVLPTEED